MSIIGHRENAGCFSYKRGRASRLVVEADAPLMQNGDLDCDGIPDTGDNNRDGEIDG